MGGSQSKSTTPSTSEQQAQEKVKRFSPTGRESQLLDTLTESLPVVIDAESKRQVDEARELCDGGKGPASSCYSIAEYMSLFERRHKDAFDLYANICYRPRHDKSPKMVEIDKTMAYPSGCFNYGKMLMTAKGGVPFDPVEAFSAFDRACRAGHGGSCFLQAKLLLSEPGTVHPDIPYNPKRAMDIYQKVCDDGDSMSCFTLATMLLRGEHVSKDANNVSPKEAQGQEQLVKRTNEEDRKRRKEDKRTPIPRDPKRAERLLLDACERSSHPPSCHNLAVMYHNGDVGVPADEEKAKKYQNKTNDLVKIVGRLF